MQELLCTTLYRARLIRCVFIPELFIRQPAGSSKTSQSSSSSARRSKPAPRAPADPSLSSPQGASLAASLARADISHFKSVRPSNNRHRWGGGRRADGWTPASNAPSLLPAAVDTSHCPLPLKSPRIIQWGRTGRRAGRGRSRPARRLAPTNDRPHPPRIIFPLLPSSRFPFAAAAAPSLVSLSQNERERRTPSWGSLNHSERASSSL